jgi:hypothetical protein
MRKIVCFCLLFVFSFSFSQVESQSEKFKSHHTASVFLSHTIVKDGIKDGKTQWVSFPSYALDYNFVFSPKWKIGLHNDVIFEDFIIEKKSGNAKTEVLERSEPFTTVLVGGFKPAKHFTFEVGMGYEFAKEEDLFLTRLGTEYAVELPKEWELVINVIYDLKWNAYDSFTIGIGLSKAFGK